MQTVTDAKDSVKVKEIIAKQIRRTERRDDRVQDNHDSGMHIQPAINCDLCNPHRK